MPGESEPAVAKHHRDDNRGTRLQPVEAVRTGGSRNWIVEALGRWWVLHTRARNEKRVASALAIQSVQHYLPLVNVRHTYAKWRVAFRVPLFPGYVFLCGNESDCEKALHTKRVAHVIPVVDQRQFRAELQHVYQAVECGEAVALYPAIQKGSRCRLTGGPLKGVEGVVVQRGSRCQIYLTITMLGQSALIEVDAALLEVLD